MLSLVAGHVTGGGGKATTKKPNGTMYLRVQQIVKTNWVLTGADSPQSNFGI